MNRHTAPFPPAGNRPPVFLPRQQVPPARHAAPHTVVPTPFPLPGYQPDHTVVTTLTSQSLAWLEENDLRFDFGQGFDFVPLPSPSDSPPPADDNPPGPHPSNDTLPPVLRALHHINEKQKSQAHRQLKQCTTIEQALVEMLAASNSGTHCHGPAPMRVGSVLGLVARLPLNSRVRETFACMCLARMRMERSAMGVANRYIDLANTLPRQFPADELGPYQQVLIACGRLAIQQIRDEDAEHFKKQPSEALDALARIENRLNDYEAQPCVQPQVSIEELRRQVGVRYPQRGTPSASSLKRRHEQTVTETTQEDPDGEADEERISPARTPAWGPSRFVGELHAMVSGGRLIVRQPVAQALRAFATCPNRQGLSRALPSIPDAQGFLDMLDLMLGLNPSAAGELALHTALSYIEHGLLMPNAIAEAVVRALPQVNTWPRDIAFTLPLMSQLNQQPALVREAVTRLIDRLLRARS